MVKTNFKNIAYLIILIIIAFTSCEKVVIIDVKSSGSKVVVQGNLNNDSVPYLVQLDNSVSYYADNVFPPILGAQVKISDNAGHAEVLRELGKGYYQTDSIRGVPGRTYFLQIISNGNTYTSYGTMPNPVPIDSFLLRPTLNRFTHDTTGYRVTCKFTDPIGTGNYYKVVISSKDTAAIGTTTGRILSDKYTDGQQLSVTFRTNLIANDSVSIQVQSITKSTFDFYNTLTNAEGEVGASQFLSSLPANPTNNISNGGLGYFAVYAETKKTIVIP